MKTEQLLRCIFPEILADYFDVIDIQESISQIDFWLDERNFMEEADRKSGTVSSYGFTDERVVHDFSRFVVSPFTFMSAVENGVTVPRVRYSVILTMT
ncbi:hypothetical protein [Prevotella corporis]|uniref:hypothetical protein n=1 Tax=Prevotella corporis TaxID=28128 RepID=UPI002366E0D3|nr:hypothetical protein [Prevotella corporis]